MIRTQIQLPDDLYREIKRVASQHEWSFAETMRRAAEYIVEVNPPNRIKSAEWKLPPAANMGLPMVPEEEWTSLSRE